VTGSTSRLLLYLVGGREIGLGIDPGDWATAFHNALVKNEAIQVEDPSGVGKIGVNPRAVLYWKGTPTNVSHGSSAHKEQ
jgi:hypothetical protein